MRISQAKHFLCTKKPLKQGKARAQVICGQMYYMGEDTAKDTYKALYWLKKTAAQIKNLGVQEKAKKFQRKYFLCLSPACRVHDHSRLHTESPICHKVIFFGTSRCLA